MKKLFSMAALALVGAGMTFTACSSDNIAGVEAPNTEQAQDNDQVLRLAVACNSENLDTRAAAGNATERKLYSAEAKQSINYVKVIIVKVSNSVKADFSRYELQGAEVVGAKTFDNWMEQSAAESPNAGERESSWKLPKEDRLKPGKYVAYAVGYTNAANYTGLADFAKIAKGDAIAKDANGKITVSHKESDNSTTTVNLPLMVTKDAVGVDEVFAGATYFTVEKKVSGNTTTDVFNATLRLHRQVAGQLTYVTNIPVYGDPELEYDGHSCGSIKATKLRLVAKTRNDENTFNDFNSAFIETATDNSNVWFKMYGSRSTKANAADALYYDAANATATTMNAYKVWETDIYEWFRRDLDGNGILNIKDTYIATTTGSNTTYTYTETVTDDDGNTTDVYLWKNPLSPTTYKTGTTTVDKETNSYSPILRRGTILAGNFLVPFAISTADDVTFELQELGYVDNDNTKAEIVIRKWDIKLPAAANAQATDQANQDLLNVAGTKNKETHYDIYRNHLYSIGKRMKDDKDNPKPDEPDPDPDDPDDPDIPENLMKQSLNIIVNAVWENVHGMDVD